MCSSIKKIHIVAKEDAEIKLKDGIKWKMNKHLR